MSNQRWLVSARATGGGGTYGSLGTLLEELRKRPDVTIDQIYGPPDQPWRLLISANASVIDQLRSRYGEQLVFAPDKSLTISS